jgi:serine/threonine-protein kinase
MAVVYLAHDTELGRPVAIKFLADHVAGDDGFRARFAREGRIAARLSHPNVVQVFDVGQEAGRPFIVMEYVAGESLGDTLRRERRLAPQRVLEIGQQTCSGLGCAHAAGLVHRDVKPQNLLVTTDGAVKIADFGVARALDQTRLTLTGSIVGTARYLAPEHAGGEPVTAAADVYALGVVLYELLAGRPPHPGDSLPDLMLAKRTKPVAPLRKLRPETGPDLEAAVLACLAVSPADRPTAEELAARLSSAGPRGQSAVVTHAASSTADARTVVLPGRRRTFGTRRGQARRAVAAAVALAVAAAVALVAALVLTSGSSPPAKPKPLRTPSGSTPAQHAGQLAHWILGHTQR